MGSNMSWPDFFFSLFFFTLLRCCSLAHSSEEEFATQSLKSFVQEYADRTVLKHRPHTGALYDAMLPQNLSGMNVSVVRLRSRRLWNRGANFSYFRIPPRTITILKYIRERRMEVGTGEGGE
ncbi:hypothetical protein K1719_011910 [Acacia pycnantha]|nr:hypothetical protein K1719_011910 [Acacia pycnantha]